LTATEEIFTTQRLRVRPWREVDIDALYALLRDPLTMAHWPQPLDAAGAAQWLQRSLAGMAEHGYARWCCERLQDARVVGDVGIVRTELEGEPVNDLGYIVHHEFWRMGYGYEAAQGAIRWAQARGLGSLEANMATDNLASIALAEKLGMTLKTEFIKASNGRKPTYWYELELANPA